VSFRSKTILAAKAITSTPPRLKGLGVVLGLVAGMFRRWDVDVEARVFGNRMILNASDYLGNLVLFTPNYYDRKERALIRRLVQKGDYVIDVGANIGIYTLILARLVSPSGGVTAIEAERENADRLRRNLALNTISWVTVRQVGVSDKDEELQLWLDGESNAGAHTFLKIDSGAVTKVQNVRCLPLSQLVEPNREPSFMKIDIEGFEFRALKQFFDDVAKQYWPRTIMLEDVPYLREGDAVALAADHGYRTLARFDFNVFLTRG
jgi:FkbM family methyltransferase